MHIVEARWTSTVERHRKCLGRLTCSACELRSLGAATCGPFKQASTIHPIERVCVYAMNRSRPVNCSPLCADDPAKSCTCELPAKPSTSELYEKQNYAAHHNLSADASTSWVRVRSNTCLHRCDTAGILARIILLQQSDISSSRDLTAEDQLLVPGTQRCLDQVPHQLAPKPCKAATQRRLNKWTANLRPAFIRGRAKDPACIKQWAALTTWLRQNLHQVGHYALAH